MRLLLAAAIAAAPAAWSGADGSGSAWAGEGRWLKARDAQRIAKAREESGEMPMSVECRHDPSENAALVKPQVRVLWAPNPSRKQWRLKITGRSRANDLLRAASRQQGYELVSRDTFSTGATDQGWMCEIWHKDR